MSFEPPEGATLVRVLGTGSLCEVAVVEHGGVQHICKRLKARFVDEPAATRAFERECTTLLRVRHPAVPDLVAKGSDARGPWSLQTSAAGIPLRALVDGYRQRDGAVSGPMLRALARAAFTALAELHAIADEHGPLELAHGDLGPDHVMIGPATRRPGRVCFVDFGMASTRDDPARAGERGTLPYIAPEVARGEQVGEQRHDVYALAASMAFAALGRDPCKSADAAARLVEIGERGVDLEALAGAKMGRVLRRVLSRALAFDPTERLQSARLAADLLAVR